MSTKTCVEGYDPSYRYVLMMEQPGDSEDRKKLSKKGNDYDLEAFKLEVEEEATLRDPSHYDEDNRRYHGYRQFMLVLCPVVNEGKHAELKEIVEGVFWCWTDKCWKKIL